jgi:NADPH-dependent 2,4-dienoyl-CoA reductase/sulfur reductase-like enzyme
VNFRYLVVGSGMTASAAIEGIRRHDAQGSIGLIGAEPFPPYNRPPLSKGLWKGEAEDTIWRALPPDVDLRLGRRAVALHISERTVDDDRGETYGFEKLLIATGSQPRRFPFESDAIYFRTLEDFRRLHELAATERTRFCVVGGGFVGSEIAAALALKGRAVTLLVPERGIGSRIYPSDLSTYLGRYYQQHGVEVLTNARAVQIDRTANGNSVVRLVDGKTLPADAVVAGIGVVPEVALAADAGLPVGDGILVDEFGHAGPSGTIFSAGDVARFPSAAFGITLRVEHEDHALSHGLAVGANMAGAGEPYTHIPYFYSDLFDLGYEAVGLLDARSNVVTDWIEPHRTGVVYYLEGERVRGVLLWGIFGKVDEARALIAERAPIRTKDLIGRIRP